MKLQLSLLILLTASSLLVVHAKEIKVGDSYPIHEKSMEQLIAERINSKNMEQELLNYTKSFEAGITVPNAIEDKEYDFVPWYVNEFEIRDEHNQLLFPKGFKINPLTKVRAPGRLVFFNESQVDWVKTVVQKGDNLVMTSGDVYTAMKTLNARVFLLDVKTHERLQVNAVPSIYEQKSNDVHFTVNQYAL